MAPVVKTNNPLINQDESKYISLVDEDYVYAAQQTINQFLLSPWANSTEQRRWVVFMDNVTNDTTLHISTSAVTDKVKRLMVQSGKFVFSAAIGSERSSAVSQYRELSQSKLFDQTDGPTGGAVKPDLVFDGSIKQQTNVAADRSEQRATYYFGFRVVDLRSGLEIFNASQPIIKSGSNRNVPWSN
jgi:PBP1b-binding outer membrane lipoprotein LpoB